MANHLLRILSICVLFTGAYPVAMAQSACPPVDWPLPALQKLKSTDWKTDAATPPDALALSLLPCLGHRDPELRDGVAFEALSVWLRSGQLALPSKLQIFNSQIAHLRHPEPQAAAKSNGFAQAFAALILAEIARADRIEPFLQPAQRSELVHAGAAYLIGLEDYRGFIPAEGWRHGVAHGADLAMQLALNTRTDRAQLEQLVLAVQSQIAPLGTHAYIHGESQRLARPVFFAVRRGQLDANFWNTFVETIAAPAPLAQWSDAFQSLAGLARLHNTKAFLHVLYFQVNEGTDTAVKELLAPALLGALKNLP